LMFVFSANASQTKINVTSHCPASVNLLVDKKVHSDPGCSKIQVKKRAGLVTSFYVNSVGSQNTIISLGNKDGLNLNLKHGGRCYYLVKAAGLSKGIAHLSADKVAAGGVINVTCDKKGFDCQCDEK